MRRFEGGKVTGRYKIYERGILVAILQNQLLQQGFRFFLDAMLSGQGAILSRVVVGNVVGIPTPSTYSAQQAMQSQINISIPKVGGYRLSQGVGNGYVATFQFKREVTSGAGVSFNEMGLVVTSTNTDKLLSRRTSVDATPIHTFSTMYDTTIDWELEVTVV